MGETRVDLLHLLEDLADAYPGGLDETILTEIVANSLDSGATRIAFAIDPTASTFTAADNGRGMRRSDLRRFHDIAATSKTRGEGIGFAGVGIKLGLLVSETVITESRRGKDHLATTWALAGRQRAPWRWVPPSGIVDGEQGTAVRLHLTTALSPLLDAAYVEAVLRRHFAPLLDAAFDEVLDEHYPGRVDFSINSRPLARVDTRSQAGDVAPIAIRIGRRRKPSAFGYLVREALPLADDARGVAISTFGKVIKRGWDWLGVIPAAPAHLRGVVEAPALSACLTLNKVDFIRSGPRGATYLAYRKALQEIISAQLARWGDAGESAEPVRHRAARPVERDIEQILAELTREFPLLATLVEPRPGGKRRVTVGRLETGLDGSLPLPLSLGSEVEEPASEGVDKPSPNGTPPESAETPTDREQIPPRSIDLPSSRGPKRPARLGLTIQYESRPDDTNLGRLVESTIWVNDAHPAYRRSVASHAEGYHLALTVAMTLSTIAVEPAQQHGFVTAFLATWGEAVNSRDRVRRARSRAKR